MNGTIMFAGGTYALEHIAACDIRILKGFMKPENWNYQVYIILSCGKKIKEEIKDDQDAAAQRWGWITAEMQRYWS